MVLLVVGDADDVVCRFSWRLSVSALAVSAAAFLVELLDQAAGVGSGWGDGAGQERQGDEG